MPEETNLIFQVSKDFGLPQHGQLSNVTEKIQRIAFLHAVATGLCRIEFAFEDVKLENRKYMYLVACIFVKSASCL